MFVYFVCQIYFMVPFHGQTTAKCSEHVPVSRLAALTSFHDQCCTQFVWKNLSVQTSGPLDIWLQMFNSLDSSIAMAIMRNVVLWVGGHVNTFIYKHVYFCCKLDFFHREWLTYGVSPHVDTRGIAAALLEPFPSLTCTPTLSSPHMSLDCGRRPESCWSLGSTKQLH